MPDGSQSSLLVYHCTTIPRAQERSKYSRRMKSTRNHHPNLAQNNLSQTKIMPETVQTSPSTPNSTLPRSSFLTRLLDWLWPVLTYEVDHFESCNSIVCVTGAPVDNDSFYPEANNSTTVKNNSNRLKPLHVEAIPELQKEPNENHQEQAIVSCKTCQVKGKACDLQRPWCSECLDQQILCFYVSPLSRTNEKDRKPKKKSTTVQPQIESPSADLFLTHD